MKNLVLAAGLATLMSGAAFAQTAPADPATTPPAAGEAAPMGTAPMTPGSEAAAPETMGMEGGSPIITLPTMEAGATPSMFLTDELNDEDIYGAGDEEIGEVEDIILAADGTVAAVVVEVGGFLGIGEKDVLVDWNAIEISVEDDDLRLVAPTLTREMLEEAQGVELDTMLIGQD